MANSNKGKSWGMGRPRTPVTRVPVLYRSAYSPRLDLPGDVQKTMKSEISRMRVSLLKRQERIAKSGEFQVDRALISDLKNLHIRGVESGRTIWNVWSRLRSLMGAEETSLTGRRTIQEREIQTFRENGIDWMTSKLLPKFGEFMEWAKDNFSSRVFSSGQAVTFFGENRGLTSDELQSGFAKWLYTH